MSMRSSNARKIRLTADQERRIEEVVQRGSYDSAAEVVEAALAAVEQRTVPGFRGTPEQLTELLAEGAVSRELSEAEFWGSIDDRTEALLVEYKANPQS